MLWKYRYSLKNDERYKKGIVKFLLSVNWRKKKEVIEALEMLDEWDIGLEQAMPMLSDIFSANENYPPIEHPIKCQEIRKRAILCLENEDVNTI